MWEEWLVDLLDTTNEVPDAMREEVSEWAVAVFWELVGSRILQNAWRKTGYDWFFEEGAGDVVDNGNDVIDDDSDGGDEECDVADMLDDVLGLGEDSDNESNNDEMLWGEA